MQELSIIIPAAGMGRRMKSYGPKSLIELDSRHTVIGRQLHILRRQYPKAEIIVVVGYEADMVMQHLGPNIKIVENEHYQETNVTRSIGMGLRVASWDSVLIVYGDLVFNRQAINIIDNYSVAVIDSKGKMAEDEVGVTSLDGRITRLSYDLETKWGQIVFLKNKELDMFRRVVWDRNHSTWFGFESLNRVIEMGGNIRIVEPKGMLLAEIDTSKDIENAQNIVGKHLNLKYNVV